MGLSLLYFCFMAKAKRYVALDENETETLQAGYRHHGQYQFRNRCQCLLLSAAGHDMGQLSGIFQVSRLTIAAWLNRWEQHGLAGLSNAKGQGRQPILSAQDAEQVKAQVRQNRQQLKQATSRLKQELAKDFSPKTLKRFLKSLVAAGGGSATR